MSTQCCELVTIVGIGSVPFPGTFCRGPADHPGVGVLSYALLFSALKQIQE